MVDVQFSSAFSYRGSSRDIMTRIPIANGAEIHPVLERNREAVRAGGFGCVTHFILPRMTKLLMYCTSTDFWRSFNAIATNDIFFLYEEKRERSFAQ